MARIPSTLGSAPAAQRGPTDAINNIDLNMFLKLMIAELQNQDPLNPLDNKDMLTQIAQIREVGATDKLTKTLDSVLLGQNIASATNLIGADITAISDDGTAIAGIVHRIAIAGGVPKLHIDQKTAPAPSTEDGNIEAGTYSYRVVWEDDKGNLFGLDFSGNQAISTTGTAGKDRAIELRNLPPTRTSKYVYRTDASGKEPYQLVAFIPNGQQASYVDRLSDEERRTERLTRDFQRTLAVGRSYEVSLSNVSSIRPPAESAN